MHGNVNDLLPAKLTGRPLRKTGRFTFRLASLYIGAIAIYRFTGSGSPRNGL